jgi:hypothetical protein
MLFGSKPKHDYRTCHALEAQRCPIWTEAGVSGDDDSDWVHSMCSNRIGHTKIMLDGAESTSARDAIYGPSSILGVKT